MLSEKHDFDLCVQINQSVSHAYFEPELKEFGPRTAWSLHNAFTGVAKVMPMTTRLASIQALGKFFGMPTEGGEPAKLLAAD